MPQGSILGPIQFLLLIVNIGSNIDNPNINIKIFVDDIKMQSTTTNIDDVENLQSNLIKQHNWA